MDSIIIGIIVIIAVLYLVRKISGSIKSESPSCGCGSCGSCPASTQSAPSEDHKENSKAL